MAEILKEWLTNRLQRTICWESGEFGEMMKNGFILANLLHSYNVINEEKLYLIRPGNFLVDIKNNWQYLTLWLQDINVHLSSVEVSNVMEGKGLALLRLFYQLFLNLDNLDRLDFLKRERKMVSSLVEKGPNRFKVEIVSEDKDIIEDDLAKPLLDEKHYIEWQRKKTAQVNHAYDYIKHRFKKTIAKIEEARFPCYQYISPPKEKRSIVQERYDIEKFNAKYPCNFVNYTYEELQRLEEESIQRKRSILNTDWAQKYMKELHQRLDKKVDAEQFQMHLRNEMMTALWNKSVGDVEAEVDLDLAKKVMKLSQFEKQMCTQIMETKHQARNLIKIRVNAEREFAEQRDQQFTQHLENVVDQVNLEIVEIDFEKHRQERLHLRLFAEKMRRKRLHYYEICYEVMLSIVDYASKYGYFKRLLDDEIPEHFIHEWKTLFFRMQPIFDILDPIEDILKENALEEEYLPEEEDKLKLEQDRQDALNDSEFIEYHNYSYPWTLDLLIPNYDPETEERKYEYLGTRILGHLVYKLLEIKYPYPPLRPPADLPNFKVKALIRNLPDKSITIPMQLLLNKKNIFVVRLEKAINFCLLKFKHEISDFKNKELSFDKFGNTDDAVKDVVKEIDEVYSRSSQSTDSGAVEPNSKKTQTPKTLPEQIFVLSAAAELGKSAYEVLSFGDSLPDDLIAAMLVEYIKNQENIHGFVIINYPNTYREAQILEDTFSGKEPPMVGELEDRDDIYLEESIIKHRKKEKDQYKDIRVSRIVSDPHKKKVEPPFESYFTCYLKLKETEDILKEHLIWDLTLDNSELIDRFYASLGLNHTFHYEVIEKKLLAQICKYILGEITTTKTDNALFGEGVFSVIDFPSSDDTRTKFKIVKPEFTVMKSKAKLSHGQDTIDQEGQEETMRIEEAQGEEESNSTSMMEDVKIQAGEEDWDYGEIAIAENIGKALAACWQEIEKTYIHDIEQQFFSKRLQINGLVPYCRFLKDKMEQIITLPSYKQDLVSKFQKDYNEFEDDWRNVNISKNEWHCRIKGLQNKLYHICDERKIFAEQKKTALILDNWVFEELTTLANTYISCMQTELNRSILTFQASHDFYFAMLKKLPPNDRMYSKELAKIIRESEDSSAGKKSAEDKVFRQLKAAYTDMYLKNIPIDYSNNPFNASIENNTKNAQKIIKDINDHYRTVISKEYSEIAKMVPTVKKKEDTGSVESVNLEESFKSNALKCVDEWIMGINGEMYRAHLRFLALQYKCYRDMKLFNEFIYKTFNEIQNHINTYYINEIKSVDRLCQYVQMAVENGNKIPESLILKQDEFTIDPNLLQFAPPQSQPPPDVLSEITDATEFKIAQLERLREQFMIIAPTGIILQQMFINLIQDFLFIGTESCEGPLFPESWKKIDPEQVMKLVFNIFGETAYVDWRDFLIYCLNIRFPTVDELLEMKKTFQFIDSENEKVIGKGDFLNEELWFELDFDPEEVYAQLRKEMIKVFLSHLYETNVEKMNYLAMLLAFCKNADPVLGFITAITVTIGKKTCYVFEECEVVVTKQIKEKLQRDEVLACAHKCAGEFLENLLTNVFHQCDERVTEIHFAEPAGSDKKKRGKKSPKHRSDKDKTENEATDSEVKKTFICRPCQDTDSQTDNPEEKNYIEEEEKSSVVVDPNLAYAVSQDIIWYVLENTMPWHFVLIPEERKTHFKPDVENVLTRLAAKTDNGDIYVSIFIADPKVVKLIHKVKKFLTLNITEEVRNVSV